MIAMTMPLPFFFFASPPSLSFFCRLPIVIALASCSFGAAYADTSQAAVPVLASPLDVALSKGWEAYQRRDTHEAATQASKIPKEHLLSPWAQGWAALSNPSASPADLVKFSKKISTLPHALASS